MSDLSINEINQRRLGGNAFLGTTTRIARPSETDGRTYADAEHLREQQQLWDEAEAIRTENAQLQAARAKALQDAREAEAARVRQALRAEFEAELKARYLTANPWATDTEWDAVKATVIAEAELDRARTAQDATRAALVRTGQYETL